METPHSATEQKFGGGRKIEALQMQQKSCPVILYRAAGYTKFSWNA